MVSRPSGDIVDDEHGRDTAGITTRLILAYVGAAAGEDAVERVLERAAVPHTREELEDERTWSTYETKVALFAAAAEVLDDPAVGRHVGASLLAHQVGGTLRLVIGALGSPQQVLRSIAKANAKFSTSATMHCLEAARGRGTVSYRLHPPRIPSRFDCDYTQGVLSQTTVLFGLPAARIAHPECQLRGDPDCVYVLSWRRRGRFWRRRRLDPGTSLELAALREQVVDLQRTVADLVSTDDLDEVLRRIATRASAAVRAQRYLLAVQFPGEAQPRVIGDGYDAADAENLGRELLAADGQAPCPQRLTAEVAAGGVRYGWLSAELSAGEGFLPAEQAQLDAYAGMAATALTRALALVDARHRHARAEALLDLSHGLAQETTEVGAAQRVVQAVPTVVDADRSALLLWDEAAGCLRVAAVHGFEERTDDLLGLVVTAADTGMVAEARREFRTRVLTASDDDPFIRALLAGFGIPVVVAAPIVVHGAYHGAVYACWSDPDVTRIGAEAQRTLASLADQAGTALAGLRLLSDAQHAARHDPLTGLANRVLFSEHLERAIAAERRQSAGAALCFVDLDGFKAVNDRYGHAAGDELLVAVGDRLVAEVREADMVARISGDEFAVLLHHLERPEDAETVGATLVRCLAEPFALRTGEVRIGGSIGIAFATGADGAEDLLKRADEAMYAAKTERGTYRVAFDGSRTGQSRRRELSN